MSASLPKLPGVFVCVSSPKRTDARLGRAPGRNEPSSPQLANSKQIKLSLVPAQLFHGARWGTGAFGESKRIWAGPLKGGSGADFRGPGCCCQDGTGPGAWDVQSSPFLLTAPRCWEAGTGLLSGLVSNGTHHPASPGEDGDCSGVPPHCSPDL